MSSSSKVSSHKAPSPVAIRGFSFAYCITHIWTHQIPGIHSSICENLGFGVYFFPLLWCHWCVDFISYSARTIDG